MLSGNTSTADGQMLAQVAVVSFKILRKWNRKTETDGCMKMTTLPSRNEFKTNHQTSERTYLTQAVVQSLCWVAEGWTTGVRFLAETEGRTLRWALGPSCYLSRGCRTQSGDTALQNHTVCLVPTLWMPRVALLLPTSPWPDAYCQGLID